jgi:hypothetical protein
MYKQIFGEMKNANWWPSDKFFFDVPPPLGIVPLQSGAGQVSVPTLSPMSNFSASLRYLARRQRSDVPYTLVRGKDELKLFHELMQQVAREDMILSNMNAFELVANWWNEVATGVNGIFKKYAEYIAAHYKKWRKTQEKKEAIKNSHDAVLFDALEATSVPDPRSTHESHALVPTEREEHQGGADDNIIDFCRVLDDSVVQEEMEGHPAAGP